jgi:hypothetical protein
MGGPGPHRSLAPQRHTRLDGWVDVVGRSVGGWGGWWIGR